MVEPTREDLHMGEILTFRQSPRRRIVSTDSGEAEILFFLGVRYERTSEPLDTKVATRKTSQARPRPTPSTGGKRRA